jgi:hypothetical protein
MTTHLALLATLAVGLTAGCVPDEHPLDQTGIAQFLFDKSVIFAADVIDESGAPVLPRQAPYEKVIKVTMSAAGAPDHGAFVDVQLDPPSVLQMIPTDGSCRQLSGTFRCTAQEDGFATFIIRSESDWSGIAELSLVGRPETDDLTVHPAGLPEEATNFSMIIEGVDSAKVPARYNALKCTLVPEPDNTFDKWPKGATRVREAEVRATPPANAPTVIANAPVIVETLNAEVFVTLDPDCGEPRTSRLRVQLDELGRSPKFYFCFSDIGADNMLLAFSSGAKTGDPRSIDAEPEPRLLRIVNVTQNVAGGLGPVEVVAVSAFDADLNKVPLTVDITSTDNTVLALSSPTAVLPSEGEDAKVVFATPLADGTASIQISPELHAQPLCQSSPITVTNP